MSEKTGLPYDVEHLPTPTPTPKPKPKRVYKKRSELTEEQRSARRENDRKWREANRALASARASASQKKRYESDPEFVAYKKASAELAYLEKTINQQS
jgi:hypothetical protein